MKNDNSTLISRKNIVNNLYDNILSRHGAFLKITPQNITEITIDLMRIVDLYNIQGVHKKNSVKETLLLLVKNTSEKDYVDNILFTINNILPSIIDSFIDLDKSNIDIIKKRRSIIILLCTKLCFILHKKSILNKS